MDGLASAKRPAPPAADDAAPRKAARPGGVDDAPPPPPPDVEGAPPPPPPPEPAAPPADATAPRSTCSWSVVYPEGWGADAAAAYEAAAASRPPPPKPAKAFPLPLDAFQATAAACLERRQSVLVAAHTSAGKTVVAQCVRRPFAVYRARSLLSQVRVCDGAERRAARHLHVAAQGALRRLLLSVSLSCLVLHLCQALSNQKFREFTDEFGDVGLLTGDVTINPTATCLVMTTEVLRSMLYKGSAVVREAALVVFDEIHYIKDPERGVVWEECIVLLPRAARCAFLSATIPNAAEFAAWVATVHGAPVSVIHTDFRPTPLQHYLFPSGGDGIHLVVEETGRFREDGFASALAAVATNAAAASASRDARQAARNGRKGDASSAAGAPKESDIYKLVKMLFQRRLDPAIVFAFSKRECEGLVAQCGDLDLLDDAERDTVETIFTSAIDGLSDDDRRLPQVAALLPTLRRGIGMHHSGLLPIVKEVVEILFGEGLIKVLFATETFSTGLNMPARTVVFTSARKFDGSAFRWLSSGEYIQMSGRAGRRGLDARGMVVLMLDERMDAAVAKDMLRGAPDALYSAFHLTYATLLTIARSSEGAADGAGGGGGSGGSGGKGGGGGGASAEALLRASFRQFQAARAAPALQARADELRSRAAAATSPHQLLLPPQLDDDADDSHEALVASAKRYEELLSARSRLSDARRSVLAAPSHSLPFLQPGRVCRVALPRAPSAAAAMRRLRCATASGPALPDGPGEPDDAADDADAGADADDDADDGSVGPSSGLPAGPALPSAAAEAAADAACEAAAAAVSAHAAAAQAARADAASAAAAAGGASRDASQDEDTSVWGVVVNFERIGGGAGGGGRPQYAVDVLLRCGGDEGDDAAGGGGGNGGGDARRRRQRRHAPHLPPFLPIACASPGARKGTPRVVQVPLSRLDGLSSLRLRLPPDLRSQEAASAAAASLVETLRRFPSGVPMLEAERDMKLGAEASAPAPAAPASAAPPSQQPPPPSSSSAASAAAAFRKLERQIEALDNAICAHPLHSDARLPQLLSALCMSSCLSLRASSASAAAKAASSLVLKGELKARRRVLSRLGHVDAAGRVTLKGRVACCVASAHELVVAELFFDGALSSLSVPVLAALVSCLVWTDKGGSSAVAAATKAGGAASLPSAGGGGAAGAAVREELRSAHKAVRDAARRVASAEAACGVPGREDADALVDSFRPELMELCHGWAKGARFVDLLHPTSGCAPMGAFEGSIVRALRRMEELLRQLGDGATAVGEAALAAKLADTAQALRRDIVFAASLFL